MSIYRTLLSHGYFPKELPPAFFTEQFARYATTKVGRKNIESYNPRDNYTECVVYQLALPGPERRHLRIPHPSSFAKLAQITAKHFKRLLKRAGRSQFSKSRPVYSSGRLRAIQGMVKLSNLGRERAGARAGASYLLKLDVSQFYPSLYTHSVGWAIDPQLRNRMNWNNRNLLGKRIDQALMDMQGKVSQGIPIGNDVSFLLAEIVLAQVDRAIRVPPKRSYRWFDDYEIACDTQEEAQAIQARLVKELHAFRLRINPRKTQILPLPQPSNHEWQEMLQREGKGSLRRPQNMVHYFDSAFRWRRRYPEAAVLQYALGMLFRLPCPSEGVGRVAQSGITQALLCEPGSAQKAFALLSFWHHNGFTLDHELLARTINQMIMRHRSAGVSSDVSWALAFCLDHNIVLGREAGQVLSTFGDDCIAIQALHASSQGLLPRGFTTSKISRALRSAELDGDHWLVAYEAVRHGFLNDSAAAVASNQLFSDLLACNVTFYRTKLPSYASIIHPGGAPEWLVRLWLDVLEGRRERDEGTDTIELLRLIAKDLSKLTKAASSHEESVVNLLDAFLEQELALLVDAEEPYC
jgi:Reverse transcriptase (RNA-dependent DNA polymerase)